MGLIHSDAEISCYFHENMKFKITFNGRISMSQAGVLGAFQIKAEAQGKL